MSLCLLLCSRAITLEIKEKHCGYWENSALTELRFGAFLASFHGTFTALQHQPVPQQGRAAFLPPARFYCCSLGKLLISAPSRKKNPYEEFRELIFSPWKRLQSAKRFCWGCPAFILFESLFCNPQQDFSQESWVGLFAAQCVAPFGWARPCSAPGNAAKCHRTWAHSDIKKWLGKINNHHERKRHKSWAVFYPKAANLRRDTVMSVQPLLDMTLMDLSVRSAPERTGPPCPVLAKKLCWVKERPQGFVPGWREW